MSDPQDDPANTRTAGGADDGTEPVSRAGGSGAIAEQPTRRTSSGVRRRRRSSKKTAASSGEDREAERQDNRKSSASAGKKRAGSSGSAGKTGSAGRVVQAEEAEAEPPADGVVRRDSGGDYPPDPELDNLPADATRVDEPVPGDRATLDTAASKETLGRADLPATTHAPASAQPPPLVPMMSLARIGTNLMHEVEEDEGDGAGDGAGAGADVDLFHQDVQQKDKLLLPGSTIQRKRYQFIRYGPVLFIVFWLSLPLERFWAYEQHPEYRDCQDFFLFNFLYFGLYSLVASSIAWSLFKLVIPLPSVLSMELLSAMVYIVSTGTAYFFFTMGLTEWSFVAKKLAFGASLTLAAVILIAYVYYVHVKQLDALGTRGGNFMADESAIMSMMTGKQAVSPAAKQPSAQDNEMMDMKVGMMMMSRTDTGEQLMFKDKFTRLLLTIVMFLATYVYCQAFTGLYVQTIDAVAASGRSTASTAVTFSTIFSLSFIPLKALMKVFAGRLDATNALIGVKPVMSFIMDLFYFSFYRNLFTKVTEFYVFAILEAISLLIEIVSFPLRMTDGYYRVSMRFGNWLRTIPLIGNFLAGLIAPKPNEGKGAYGSRIVIDFFFRSAAETTTLFVFVVNLVLLHFNYNQRFYPFSPANGFSRDQLALLGWFSLGMMVSEAIELVIVRRLATKLLHKSAFGIGSTMLKSRSVRIVLVTVTIHIIQDVYLALNEANFCSVVV